MVFTAHSIAYGQEGRYRAQGQTAFQHGLMGADGMKLDRRADAWQAERRCPARCGIRRAAGLARWRSPVMMPSLGNATAISAPPGSPVACILLSRWAGAHATPLPRSMRCGMRYSGRFWCFR